MHRNPFRNPFNLLIPAMLLLLVSCGGGESAEATGSSGSTVAVATHVSESATAAVRQFGERAGQDDPVLIMSIEELQAIKDGLDGHYALGADIDATPTEDWAGGGFEPIGTQSDPFTGSLDGRGHVITGLFINRGHDSQIGLFGYTAQEAEISGVGLVEARVTGMFETGALVGHSRGSIWDSYSENSQVSGSTGSGGLVGELRGSDSAPAIVVNSYSIGQFDGGSNSGGLVGTAIAAEISGSHSAGTVSGSNYLGGLVGWQNGSSITGSHSSATVTATGTHVGGLVGTSTGSISLSHSEGDVTGTDYVGGLVGHNSADISASYSLGAVSGTTEVGGLTGRNMGGILAAYSQGDVSGTELVGGMVGSNQGRGAVNSYSTGAVFGDAQVGGLTGFNGAAFNRSYWDGDQAGLTEPDNDIGMQRTSEQMMQQATYEEWDFDGTWTIAEGSDYPDLRENPR